LNISPIWILLNSSEVRNSEISMMWQILHGFLSGCSPECSVFT
jgi:hypothetical protein